MSPLQAGDLVSSVKHARPEPLEVDQMASSLGPTHSLAARARTHICKPLPSDFHWDSPSLLSSVPTGAPTYQEDTASLGPDKALSYLLFAYVNWSW